GLFRGLVEGIHARLRFIGEIDIWAPRRARVFRSPAIRLSTNAGTAPIRERSCVKRLIPDPIWGDRVCDNKIKLGLVVWHHSQRNSSNLFVGSRVCFLPRARCHSVPSSQSRQVTLS